MALQVYLISRSGVRESGGRVINGITEMLATTDDANPDATKLTIMESVLQIDGVPIPDGYFDTVELIGPPTAGIMTTSSDYILFADATQDGIRNIT